MTLPGLRSLQGFCLHHDEHHCGTVSTDPRLQMRTIISKRVRSLTAIDVFSGCGGMSQGLRKAGFVLLAGVESCPIARDVHRSNHPGVHLFEDVRVVTPGEVLETLQLEPGELDLLAGCPPCQGFSRLRTLNGTQPADDPRNELIFDFLKLVCGLLPKTVLLENVPALLSDQRFFAVEKQLQLLGYACTASVLDAARFGVPQRRKRMIMMASRLGRVELPQGQSELRTVRDAIWKVKPRNKGARLLHAMRAKHTKLVLQRIRSIPHDGGSRVALGPSRQLKCHRGAKIGFRDIYGRMAWDKVAPTITRFCHNPSKGRFLHPDEDRAISVYEASLLQTFPQSYRFPGGLSRPQIASMIGEALPPQFAEKQARCLKSHILSSRNAKTA